MPKRSQHTVGMRQPKPPQKKARISNDLFFPPFCLLRHMLFCTGAGAAAAGSMFVFRELGNGGESESERGTCYTYQKSKYACERQRHPAQRKRGMVSNGH